MRLFLLLLTVQLATTQATERVSCGSGWKFDTPPRCAERGCDWHIDRCVYPASGSPIKNVHVVQGCHLDVGFKKIAPDIINEFFHVYFPRALQVGTDLDARNGTERLHFTAQSWLVSLFLDCPAQSYEHVICPTEEEVSNFTLAVKRGYITWHAFPFNGELEFMDASLVRFGLDLTHEVDATFGLANKTVMSQRDVPGTTRAAIPIMRSAGVDTLSVGVNGGSTPPNVPPAFTWKEPVSGNNITVFYNHAGYGGLKVLGHYDYIRLPQCSDVLVVDWRGDNSGPPNNADEVLKDFADLRREFPRANVIPSTFEKFAEAVRQSGALEHLPVLANEIGDTWVHGVASDPKKHAMTRAAQRMRSKCLESGECVPDDPRLFHFSRKLLKNGEHTWGVDQKRALNKRMLHGNWSNSAFQESRSTDPSPYQVLEESWRRQRRMGLEDAVAALGNHSLANQVLDAWSALDVASPPNTTGFQRLDSHAAGPFTPHGVKLGFDPNTGAITTLENMTSGTVYASPQRPIAELLYRTYSAEDYTKFMLEYNYMGPLFILDDGDDFDKIGIKSGGAKSSLTPASLEAVWVKNSSQATTFLLQLGFPKELCAFAGAPSEAWLRLDITSDTFGLEVVTLNKTTTRLPEAMFLRFAPPTDLEPSMEKLGIPVDPLNVLTGGSRHCHVVSDGGVRFGNDKMSLQILPEDAGLVSWGSGVTAFPTPIDKPTDGTEVSFVLWDNLWNTNYIMWYPFDEKDAASRFRWSLEMQ